MLRGTPGKGYEGFLRKYRLSRLQSYFPKKMGAKILYINHPGENRDPGRLEINLWRTGS
jgi:hypothetical protein